MKQRHQVLFQQLFEYRHELLDVVESVSEEEAEIIPPPFRNNIRWNLGHVYLDQYLWIQALTKENLNIPAILIESFGFGTSPLSFTEETPKMEDLKKLLNEQPEIIKIIFKDRLEEKFTPIDMGIYTIEQVLIRTIFHEGMHLQAINNIKMCIQNLNRD